MAGLQKQARETVLPEGDHLPGGSVFSRVHPACFLRPAIHGRPDRPAPEVAGFGRMWPLWSDSPERPCIKQSHVVKSSRKRQRGRFSLWPPWLSASAGPSPARRASSCSIVVATRENG